MTTHRRSRLLAPLLALTAVLLGACGSSGGDLGAPATVGGDAGLGAAIETVDAVTETARGSEPPLAGRPTQAPESSLAGSTVPFVPDVTSTLNLTGTATAECGGELRVGAEVGGKPTLRCHPDEVSAEAGEDLLWSTPLGRNGNLYLTVGTQLLVRCEGTLTAGPAPTEGRWVVSCNLAPSPGVDRVSVPSTPGALEPVAVVSPGASPSSTPARPASASGAAVSAANTVATSSGADGG